MKTKHFIYLLFISLIVVSCGDDKDENPTPTVEDTTEYFRCKLNGIPFTDDARFAAYFSGNTRIVSQNNEEMIVINIDKDTTGTFVITGLGQDNDMYYSDSLNKQYEAISATIIVTEYSKSKKVMSGIFTGVLQNLANANDKITITEGKFNKLNLGPF